MSSSRTSSNASGTRRWNPWNGLLRAAIHGGIVATILIVVSVPVALNVPSILFNPILRAFIAFALAWLLFGVVQDAAGMTGLLASLHAALLASLVLGSHNLIMAQGAAEVATGRDYVHPGEWLEPVALLVTNVPSLIGIGAGWMLCHDGTPGGSAAGDILSLRIWWGSGG